MTVTNPTGDDPRVVKLIPRQPPALELPGPDETIPHFDDQPPPDDHPTHRPTSKPGDRSNDPGAERQVLGAALTSPTALQLVAPMLTGRDFWEPDHETIWHAITDLHQAGRKVDAITVADHITAAGSKPRPGLLPLLSGIIGDLITPGNADAHADILRQHTLRRAYQQTAERLHQLAGTPAFNPVDAVTRATLEITELRNQLTAGNTDDQHTEEVHDFLAHATEDDPPDWLIPDLLEHGDRLIITAAEGHGKSTLLRQIAVQTAAGIHPFTLEEMLAARVLIVDLENSERQTRRELRPLTLAAHERLDRGQLHVACKIDGLDLATPDGLAWLDQAIQQTRPDLLITGPIYKMATGNPNEEKEAKPIAMGLDQLRARHGIGVILEAHSAKTPAGINPKNRPKEPFGWSGWMRWPEFGLHLAEDGTLTPWRGGRDQHTRTWPDQLHRGGPWPWTPAQPRITPAMNRWAQIHSAITQAGRRLSINEIATATGIPRSSVGDLLQANASHLNRLYSQIEE